LFLFALSTQIFFLKKIFLWEKNHRIFSEKLFIFLWPAHPALTRGTSVHAVTLFFAVRMARERNP
jgi:hypothetical protein